MRPHRANQFVFNCTPKVKSFLLHEGTDPKYGARHLKRAIERHLVFPLANLVATGQVKLGDFIRIDLSPEGQLMFVKEAEGAMVPMLLERYGAAAAEPAAGCPRSASRGNPQRIRRTRRRHEVVNQRTPYKVGAGKPAPFFVPGKILLPSKNAAPAVAYLTHHGAQEIFLLAVGSTLHFLLTGSSRRAHPWLRPLFRSGGNSGRPAGRCARSANRCRCFPRTIPVTKYVQRLGQQLAAHAPGEKWPYTFHVVNQKEINAFALPGGPVFVNLGTIQAGDNEAELAGVMAHEISHVVQRHGTRAASKQMAAQLPLAILGGVMGRGRSRKWRKWESPSASAPTS